MNEEQQPQFNSGSFVSYLFHFAFQSSRMTSRHMSSGSKPYTCCSGAFQRTRKVHYTMLNVGLGHCPLPVRKRVTCTLCVSFPWNNM